MGSGGVGGGLKRPLRRLCPPQRLLQVMLRMRSGNRVVGEKAVFDGENRDRSETPLGEDQIGADGRFTLTTFVQDDGCVVGVHPVEVMSDEFITQMKTKHLVPPKYHDANTSGLTASIDGPTEHLEINLTWGGGKPYIETFSGGDVGDSDPARL